MPTKKTITVADFLTAAEIAQAAKLYELHPNNFARVCSEQIIEPNMERINAALGQNHPMYLAYCVEYSFMVLRASNKLTGEGK